MSVKTPQPCKEDGLATPCPYPRCKRSTKWCLWHWLKRQPATVQAEYAAWRLAQAEKAEGYTFRARVPEVEWPDGKRWCSGCQSFVPRLYCRGSRCIACESGAAHENRVTDQYGLKPGQYKEILEAQGRKCAICRARPISVRLAVDHDHRSQAVRGLLCSRCNHDLLGSAHDALPILVRAVAYLLAPPAADAVKWEQTVQDVARVLGVQLRELETPGGDPFSTPAPGRSGPSRAQAGAPF